MANSLSTFLASSPFYGGNAEFLEDLYERFLTDPNSLPSHWREHFQKLQASLPQHSDVPHAGIRSRFKELARRPPLQAEIPAAAELAKHIAVNQLIDQHRLLGHLAAETNPLPLAPKPYLPELDPVHYQLDERDLDTEFDASALAPGSRMKLRDILTKLRRTYCGPVGSEIMHLTHKEARQWLIERLETSETRLELSAEQKKHLLKGLIAAEGIEKYLHRRYVGQKRFSLEGGESLIPLIDELIQHAGSQGVREVVIGMAHRGRLNVLINILGKQPKALFEEFEGLSSPLEGTTGDVKYHMGFSSDVQTPGGPVHLALAFNPSHLEIIDPVVQGSVRARQDRYGEGGHQRILPLLIHGDAAFAGQGVVMETLQMGQTRAFYTGGTVHVVINNQIGFTTSNPHDARSTLYATDVAKMVEAPVFHVNGDDPEAVLFVVRLALDFRLTFQRDVVIDLVCYRRHGHNEADEPAVTQPVMYRHIRSHPSVVQLYAQKLVAEKIIDAEWSKATEQEYLHALEQGYPTLRPVIQNSHATPRAPWHRYLKGQWDMPYDNGFPQEKLTALARQWLEIPEGFELHPRVAKIWEDRLKMTQGELPLDWGYAENMAYATLLTEGVPIRLTGQDSGRGTFFHRHGIVYHYRTGEPYLPLTKIAALNGSRFYLYDSLLSEEGALGFEYGYSSAAPEALVIWEAQFGDFANVAQVVIDQFISSGEAKWGRLSGLVLFLPHGYEGQGPEHSSARLERFLQLCAEDNLQVCIPTTPAQIFHLLRRQVHRPYRKPLIVLTPKSLLRHRLAVSTLEELSQGRFELVIDEIDSLDPRQVHKIILCAGKIYYELLESRRQKNLNDIAILRLEQLYPFPFQALAAALARYPNLKELIWCQEEPQNQGAWYQIRHCLEAVAGKLPLAYVGRPPAAAPAEGTFLMHVERQHAIIDAALHSEKVALKALG
ncbi:MAG: 2-oxoglutarate dehydrogenase E1 component [Methylohalobius sp.]|nr:2-oxoglutarate dehydrogenase E1 component [Methylohalobius sp.]